MTTAQSQSHLVMALNLNHNVVGRFLKCRYLTVNSWVRNQLDATIEVLVLLLALFYVHFFCGVLRRYKLLVIASNCVSFPGHC